MASNQRLSIFGLIVVIATSAITWIVVTTWFEQRAIDRLQSAATRTAMQQTRLFDSELARFRLLPIVLGEYTDLREALSNDDPRARVRMDAKLKLLAERTGAPVIYLLNLDADTVSSSNAGTPESFVGNNYRFRSYFIDAMRSGAAEYYAVGNVSGRPGLFLARRIGTAADPLGVVVVKVEFEAVTHAWSVDPGQSLVIDGRGIVLFGTDPDERFTTLRPLSPALRRRIAGSGQFGTAPLLASHYRIGKDATARGPTGERMIVGRTVMPVPGWRLLNVVPAAPSLAEARNLARLTTFTATLLVAAVVIFLLWWNARAAVSAAIRERLEAAVEERTAALREEMAERVAIDRRFRDAREELAQANRLGSLGSITAGLVHEINQPVATIRTLSENALHHLAGGRVDRVGKSLASVVEMTARIGSITQEMRRFARRGKGRIGPVELDAVIASARLLMADRFRAAQVTLDLPPAGQPAVVAGRVRLEQVVVNLLQNALDAVAGTADARIATVVERQGDTVTVTVADNGPGIDPALADVIFEPFVTGKAEGLGLGLGIVRDIMAEFDGTVAVVPSPLGGAAFRVTLIHAGENVV
ncbi:ATP-binding protein [Sphingomonas sp. KR1UV-12]|uniref:histidine kinase n=1 Tax=Sphingomonas aurea TaxID=3063994 RepID=A0ABT9EIM7_9SPHN|nr:ATP-binding protein [Sphingomonas sp. KR1UV-12]MDP1026832.1 ATP-binding protein [Sphingomonas sp. KR1UV-12]